MSVLKTCIWYGYNLNNSKQYCDKRHIAGDECHSKRKDCPDYISTQEYNESIEAIGDEL